MTAEHWGEDAREKAEGKDWQGLYWQSYILTAQTNQRGHLRRSRRQLAHVHEAAFFRKPSSSRSASAAATASSSASASSRGLHGHFEAYDIAPDAVAVATEEAERAGIGDRIDYAAADLNTMELEPDRYGAVFAAQTLHHIEALEHLLDQIHGSLTKDGLFVVNEYVGPKRFQIPERVPPAHGRTPRGAARVSSAEPQGRPSRKRRRFARTADEVYEVDPSESVRSDEIMGLIEERFEIVFRADFGGTLLQFVLSDIAGNFDPPTRRTWR